MPIHVYRKYLESTSRLIAHEAVPFQPTYFNESGRKGIPFTWWTAVGRLLAPKGHSKDCLKYISASIERMFSNFGETIQKLLNPKYRGKGLSNIQKESAHSCISKYLESTSLLIAHEAAPFQPTYFNECLSKENRKFGSYTYIHALQKIIS